MSSILYEYDEEETLAYIAEEQYGLGITQGECLKLINQMIKKVQKSKPLDVIADELECEPEEIQKFYDAIVQNGTECDAKEILETLQDASNM